MAIHYQPIKDNLFSIALFCFIALLLFVIELWLTIQTPDIKESSLLPQISRYTGNSDNGDKDTLTDELTILYEQYDKETITEQNETLKIATGMDDEQQLLQEGNLTQLFIGENKYKLIGTFSTIDKNSALLTVNHVNKNTVKTIEIKQDEKIGEWEITTIAPNSIEFVNKHRIVTLQIFTRINAE